MSVTARVSDALRRLARRSPGLHRLLLSLHLSWRKGGIRRVLHYLQCGHLRRWLVIRSFLKGSGPKHLQIGGGLHLLDEPGWLNGDLIAGGIYLNAHHPLPFPDNSLDTVFSEHFFEHLPLERGMMLLKQLHRVLRPGGVLRQSMPELKGLVDVYLDDNALVSREEVVNRHFDAHYPRDHSTPVNGCSFLNDMFRLWGHQFVYDRETLRDVTEAAGFRRFNWVEYGKSEHPQLRGLERHSDPKHPWMRTAFIMVCEARKTD